MEILFATNNRNKVREVQSLLPEELRVLTLSEAGLTEEIPEPFESLEENARAKIQYALRLTGKEVGFSEDSGLFVTALHGKPGVHSARYAGEHRNDSDNIDRVLKELEGVPDRTAYFQTTICLIWEGQEHFFTGTCLGLIRQTPAGQQGFGYDPIFQPNGSDRSFAEMGLSEKNQFSHREKALRQMIQFLRPPKKSE